MQIEEKIFYFLIIFTQIFLLPLVFVSLFLVIFAPWALIFLVLELTPLILIFINRRVNGKRRHALHIRTSLTLVFLWLIALYIMFDYSPSFFGRVVDAPTDKGIPDVSICYYIKGHSLLAVAHPVSVIFKRGCTRTDNNGNFSIPAYIGMRPFSYIGNFYLQTNDESDNNPFYEKKRGGFDKIVTLQRTRETIKGCEDISSYDFDKCYVDTVILLVKQEKIFFEAPFCDNDGICDENEYLYSCQQDCQREKLHFYRFCHRASMDKTFSLIHNTESLQPSPYLDEDLITTNDECGKSKALAECYVCYEVNEVRYPIIAVNIPSVYSDNLCGSSFQRIFIDEKEVVCDKHLFTQKGNTFYYPYNSIFS